MQFLHDFHTANETFAVKFDFALSKLVLVHEDDVHAEAIRNFLTHFFTAIHTDGTCVADCDENSEHGNVVQLQNCEIIRKFNAHADFRRRRQSSFRQASLGDRRRGYRRFVDCREGLNQKRNIQELRLFQIFATIW